MKHKIIPILMAFLVLIASIVVIICILLYTCGSKSIKAEAETSHAETYELYTLNESYGESRLILYDIYKVKSENIKSINSYGNIITTYNATDGTQIIFADNGITIISPKGYKESFTQGYMWRK